MRVILLNSPAASRGGPLLLLLALVLVLLQGQPGEGAPVFRKVLAAPMPPPAARA